MNDKSFEVAATIATVAAASPSDADLMTPADWSDFRADIDAVIVKWRERMEARRRDPAGARAELGAGRG